MKIILYIAFLIGLSHSVFSQRCEVFQLTDGGEPVFAYGMDTTFHWWAVTKPFSNKFRLIVDGNKSDVYDSFTYPVFSPNGNNWGAFAEYNGRFELILNDSIIDINSEKPGEIVFAALNDEFLYSYINGSLERIHFKDEIFETYNRAGRIFLSQYGDKYAYVAERGSGYVVNINENETTLFEDIRPMGFWYDGRFMYAAKNGWGWEIYLNEEKITQTYDDILEMRINKFGTNAAFLVSMRNTGMYSVLISDEYYEPIHGNTYDMCTGLVLHPEFPLIAYKTKYNTNYLVVFNNTEYPAQEEVGEPHFTHNGDELYFIHCNIDCDLNVNGKNIPLKAQFPPNGNYAVKPESNSIAYCSSTSLIVKNYLYDDYSVSYMLDEISDPVYNRFEGTYEAIGRIFNKLYIVSCTE
jgi:hypothetical protein